MPMVAELMGYHWSTFVLPYGVSQYPSLLALIFIVDAIPGNEW
jgi:hypothetical protein